MALNTALCTFRLSYDYNFHNKKERNKVMGLIKRQPGDRRWGMVVEFPMTDSHGVYVMRDRRSGMDRRKARATLEDLLILFSQAPSVDPGEER